MTTTRSTFTPAAITVLVLLGLDAAPSVAADSAANIDWVPASGLSAEQHEELPWYCDGLYVQPPGFADAEPVEDDESLPIEASANSASHKRDRYTKLIGNVELRQGPRLVKSPGVTLDERNEVANIDGPMRLREAGLLMTGSHAEVNLVNGTGTLQDANFLLHEPRLRGHARQIDRNELTDLIIRQGQFTRCEPTSNTWAISGKYIRLEPRTGFGTARNVTISVKDVPVAWVPWIRFPIDDERHSGFLMPSLSSDSEGGTDITVPWYFNLAPAYDLTYSPRSIWKRGLLHDIQARLLTEQSSNEINAAWLHKDDKFDDRELFDRTSAGDSTVPAFEKEDRWLLYIHHNAGWSRRWQSQINYSAVSDTEYLEDIGGDVGSASVQEFYSPIERNLTDRRSVALDRNGKIEYRGDTWTHTLLLKGFQNLDPRGQEQYEMLPRLSTAATTPLWLFDLDLELEYTRFDKDNETLRGPLAIVGERALVDAGASLPLRNIWGFLEPSVSVIHRRYNLNDTPAGVQTDPTVTTPVFSLDSGLYFDRFFDWGSTALQQTLEPRLFYLYVEEDEQDDLPQFEASPLTPSFAQLFRENRFSGEDRIGDANQLSLGITSRFMQRDTGAEFFSASIGQIWYFKDREVVFKPDPGFDPGADTSAIFTQARLTLANGLRATGSYEWDHRVNRSNRGKLSLKYTPDERHIFNLSYIQNNEQVERINQFKNEEESDLSFIWPVTGQWSVIGRWNFGWDEHRTIESVIGVEYNDCCWKSRLVFRRFIEEPGNITLLVDDPSAPNGVRTVDVIENRADTGIFFEFQMKGLATLGRRLDSLLEDAIAGYREREEKIGL